jgi:hypothetical protein
VLLIERTNLLLLETKSRFISHIRLVNLVVSIALMHKLLVLIMQ